MDFRGDKLRKLIEDRGWTPAQAADKLGWKPQYLNNVLNGHKKNLREETITKITDLFKVHKNYFYLEDAVLLKDLVPNAPESTIAFISNGDNTPYIRISEEAKEAGISPDRLKQLIEIISSHKSEN